MQVTYLGHAGLKVETSSATLLCDPLLSPEGTFQGSWFPYPDNANVLASDPGLTEPTAIVISHEHLDHIDPWLLARIPSHVPAVIFKFPSPVLRRKILEVRERPIIEMPAWESVELAPGTSVFFVPEESPMNHDVGIVITGDGQTLLDLNDARLAPLQFREIKEKVGGKIDLFALQGAGASWYPMCYEYTPERRKELSRQKRLAKFGYMTRSIGVVKPTTVIPFAGPPCFLDPELYKYNAEMENGIFPDQQQVVDWLSQRGINNCVVLLPGDAWDIDGQRKVTDSTWDGFSFASREPYLSDYAARRRPNVEAALARYPVPTESLWPAFQRYFEHLLTLSPYFNSRIAMRVGFELTGPGGGDWAVDFRPGMEGVHDTLGDSTYIYRFESRWAVPLLAGTMPWEDFFLSLRFEARRNPDLYNDHLLGLLKFAHSEALAAVEQYETSMEFDEMITVRSEGQTYRVQRYCPHAGNDLLQNGEVLPGNVLRCLAHHYDFSLDTGACITAQCPALRIEHVSSSSSASTATPASGAAVS